MSFYIATCAVIRNNDVTSVNGDRRLHFTSKWHKFYQSIGFNMDFIKRFCKCIFTLYNFKLHSKCMRRQFLYKTSQKGGHLSAKSTYSHMRYYIVKIHIALDEHWLEHFSVVSASHALPRLNQCLCTSEKIRWIECFGLDHKDEICRVFFVVVWYLFIAQMKTTFWLRCQISSRFTLRVLFELVVRV